MCLSADFVIVLSTWGMTQGLVMPFSGFLINAIGPKVRMDLVAPGYSFTFRPAWSSAQSSSVPAVPSLPSL